jgi:multiple sugar transport system permease protein
MVVSSLKPEQQLLRDMSSLRAFLPVGDISFDNYAGVFQRVNAWRFIFNSVFVTTMVVMLGLFVNSLAAFALSRLQWRGAKYVLSALIATLIIPADAVVIPQLLLVSRLPRFDWSEFRIVQSWQSTYIVQIVPFVASAFFVFLLYGYFRSLPKELDEAARIDGASWWQIYRRIILPLSGPVLATVAILTFLGTWNSYLWPILTVPDGNLRPVMTAVAAFQQLNPARGEMMAYLTLITVPVLLFFLVLQRSFIESIASQGVKG